MKTMGQTISGGRANLRVESQGLLKDSFFEAVQTKSKCFH